MEKLIELLNEYWEKDIKSEFDVRVYIEMRTNTRKFIKWLVDNDKIEYDKAKGFKLLPLDTVIWFRLGENEKESLNRLNYYKLLMLLSIQDNPIEFLVSILK